MPSSAILEIACFNLESVLTAQVAGADRIELCENYEAGGITPSKELIRQVKALAAVPVHVMIRPRAGNFVYTPGECAEMENSIFFCKELGINGVVFGMLTPEHEVDLALCSHLTRLARPMPVTFHRAIDACNDVKRSIQSLIGFGLERILTSGRGNNALEGLAELKILQKIFGSQITLMPGGSIRSSNLEQLFSSGCKEYHSSGITSGPNADANEIRAMAQLLRTLSSP
jgi:copper homeostasis protein